MAKRTRRTAATTSGRSTRSTRRGSDLLVEQQAEQGAERDTAEHHTDDAQEEDEEQVQSDAGDDEEAVTEVPGGGKHQDAGGDADGQDNETAAEQGGDQGADTAEPMSDDEAPEAVSFSDARKSNMEVAPAVLQKKKRRRNRERPLPQPVVDDPDLLDELDMDVLEQADNELGNEAAGERVQKMPKIEFAGRRTLFDDGDDDDDDEVVPKAMQPARTVQNISVVSLSRAGKQKGPLVALINKRAPTSKAAAKFLRNALGHTTKRSSMHTFAASKGHRSPSVLK